MDKIKLLWNEDAMKEHLEQLRAQSSALQLLLLVLQTCVQIPPHSIDRSFTHPVRGSMSEVKSNIANVEAALLQLSISAENGEEGAEGRPPEYTDHILDGQSDLLNLEWSDNENSPTEQRHSIHAEMLREAFTPQSNDIRVQKHGAASRSTTPITLFSTPAIELDASETLAIPKRSSMLGMESLDRDSCIGIELPQLNPSDQIASGATPDSNILGVSSTLEFLPTLHGLPTLEPFANAEAARKFSSSSSLRTASNIPISSQGRLMTDLEAGTPEFDHISDCDESKDPQCEWDTSMDNETCLRTETAEAQERTECKLLPDLVYATSRGDFEAVSKLLNTGHDIESRHPTNRKTALIVAAGLGNLEIMELLLDKNASVDARDRVSRTALHYAASEGYRECVQLLLSRGASTETTDRWLENPLHRAARYERVDTFKILLDGSSNPMQPQTSRGSTILHLAIENRRPDMVKLICERTQRMQQHKPGCPARPDDHTLNPACFCPWTFPGCELEDGMGRTALQEGLYLAGTLPAIEALLKYSSAGVDTCQIRGRSWSHKEIMLLQGHFEWERPLHFLLRRKHVSTELIAIFLKAGADPDLLNSRGQTPLELAIGRKNESVAKALLAHGAQLDSTSSVEKGVSLLGLAMDNFLAKALLGLVATACTSLSKHANLDIAFVHEAQARHKWDYVQALLEALRESSEHSNDRLKNILNKEQTLKLAIEDQNEIAVRLILEAGADVHAKLTGPEDYQCHAIHISASEKSIPILKLLIQHGASIADQDFDSVNTGLPFHYAVRYSNLEMIANCLIYSLDNFSVDQDPRPFSIEDLMKYGTHIACTRGSLEKLEFLIDIAKDISLDLSFSRTLLRSAVGFGRVAIVKTLLKRGLDPQTTYKFDRGQKPVMDVEFWPKPASRGQLANTPEEYEECKYLVQEAMDKKTAELAGQGSKRKEKRRSRKP
jgi:ankyrin repeat protein